MHGLELVRPPPAEQTEDGCEASWGWGAVLSPGLPQEPRWTHLLRDRAWVVPVVSAQPTCFICIPENSCYITRICTGNDIISTGVVAMPVS